MSHKWPELSVNYSLREREKFIGNRARQENSRVCSFLETGNQGAEIFLNKKSQSAYSLSTKISQGQGLFSAQKNMGLRRF